MAEGGMDGYVEVAEKLELLMEQEWANIRKMSTERLRARLSKEGYEKELVASVTERRGLLELLVECVFGAKPIGKGEETIGAEGDGETIKLERIGVTETAV
jgi:hypothetical protein